MEKGGLVREEAKKLVWSDGANAGEACVRMSLCVCVWRRKRQIKDREES